MSRLRFLRLRLRASADSLLLTRLQIDGSLPWLAAGEHMYRTAGRSGIFHTVIESIKKAKKNGFKVCTNTSVYKYADVGELEQLFALLRSINVDGLLISPAFSYQSVLDDIFLSKEEAAMKFRGMDRLFEKYPFISTPMYIDFLQGRRRLRCTPWGNPTRNPLGWKSPCYLITDEYCDSFRELMDKTDWERYESGKDPRCRNCMVHSGYEASAMRNAFSNPRDLLRLAVWNFR